MKLVDADEIVKVAEEDLKKLPRKCDYDEGYIAGAMSILRVLRLTPEVKE